MTRFQRAEEPSCFEAPSMPSWEQPRDPSLLSSLSAEQRRQEGPKAPVEGGGAVGRVRAGVGCSGPRLSP